MLCLVGSSRVLLRPGSAVQHICRVPRRTDWKSVLLLKSTATNYKVGPKQHASDAPPDVEVLITAMSVGTRDVPQTVSLIHEILRGALYLFRFQVHGQATCGDVELHSPVVNWRSAGPARRGLSQICQLPFFSLQ